MFHFITRATAQVRALEKAVEEKQRMQLQNQKKEDDA
jgi:hypothetical protein